MGRIEDLAAEMRAAGMSVDDHMLYTIFIDALPAEYEVKQHNLASRDSTGRDDIINAAREQFHRLSGTRRRGPTLATQTMLCTPAVAAVAVVAGKVEAVAEKKVDDGDSIDDAVEAPTRTVMDRPRLLVTMAAAPKPPAEVL